MFAISVVIDFCCYMVERDCFFYFIKYIRKIFMHSLFEKEFFYFLIYRDKYRVFMEFFNMGAYLIPEDYKRGEKPYSVP